MGEVAFNPEPVTLDGRFVQLVPLSSSHAADLLAAAGDPDIWRYMPVGPPENVAAVEAWIDAALAERQRGVELPFAIIERQSGAAIGSTRYLDIRRPHRALEIGWTWLASAWQRTPVNTECKLLLLTHAFEKLGALRVQFKTDSRNLRSRQALERIGAIHEGILRSHMLMWDGARRDSVYYSILDSEWPAVRPRLESRLIRQ